MWIMILQDPERHNGGLRNPDRTNYPAVSSVDFFNVFEGASPKVFA